MAFSAHACGFFGGGGGRKYSIALPKNKCCSILHQFIAKILTCMEILLFLLENALQN